MSLPVPETTLGLDDIVTDNVGLEGVHIDEGPEACALDDIAPENMGPEDVDIDKEPESSALDDIELADIELLK